MTNTPPLPDGVRAGFEAREAGIAANLAGAHKVYDKSRDRIERALGKWTRSGRPFTANSIDAEVLADGEGEYNRLVLASLMSHWAKARKIVEVHGMPQARAIRRARHGSVLRWWRGTTVPEQGESDTERGAA